MVFIIMLLLGYYVLIISEKNKYKNSIYAMFLYGIPVIILSSPWLIKNYFETGNPFYPVFNSLFLGNEYLIKEALDRANDNTKNLFTMFWSISTGFTARGFGKPIGPVFLALLPGIFIIKNIPKSII